MKSPKRWYWAVLLVVVLVLATATTPVKGDRSNAALEKFQADGVVALTSSSSLGGTIKGNEIGTATIADSGYSGSFLGVTGNGSDGCVLGGGVITITAADGSTLNLVRSGLDCDVSGTGITGGATGNHVYMMTGGTGRFAGAVGSGNYIFTINDGKVVIHIDGNIQAAGDRDQG